MHDKITSFKGHQYRSIFFRRAWVPERFCEVFLFTTEEYNELPPEEKAEVFPITENDLKLLNKLTWPIEK